MKLIKPAFINREPVRLESRRTRTLFEWAFNQPLTSPCRQDKFLERTTWSNPHVYFDETLTIEAGIVSKKDVVFGKLLYKGMFPIKQIEGNIYECSVDNVGFVEAYD